MAYCYTTEHEITTEMCSDTCQYKINDLTLVEICTIVL